MNYVRQMRHGVSARRNKDGRDAHMQCNPGCVRHFHKRQGDHGPIAHSAPLGRPAHVCSARYL